MDYRLMDFKNAFIGPMFSQKSDCPGCKFWGKDKTVCKGCLERNRIKFEEPKLF